MGLDFYTLDDFDLTGKRVLLRLDINSPIDPSTGDLLDDSRMRQHAETIKALSHAKVVILAHQSKPGKSDFTPLDKHARRLSSILGKNVVYCDSLFDRRALGAMKALENGDVLLLENTRFFAEDVALKDKDVKVQVKSHIIRNLAPASDYFVNDAFAAAHRNQPTIVGFCEVLPSAAGRIMQKELVSLGKVIHGADRPTLAILGGAKVDDSIDVMTNMLQKGIADKIMTTGVVANIFLLAKGYDVGKPSVDFLEKEVEDWRKLVEAGKGLLATYGEKILVPTDVAVNDNGERIDVTFDQLPSQHQIMDLGIDTVVSYIDEIEKARTICLNGPAGVFEIEQFAFGTLEIFKAISESDAYTVIGGGHTSAVAEQLHLEGKVNHISTGGGALINYLAGKNLPAVEALKRSKIKFPKKEHH
ncbi:MAG: phosphoglycerate kinase [Methanobacteriota archaeon]